MLDFCLGLTIGGFFCGCGGFIIGSIMGYNTKVDSSAIPDANA